MLLPHFVEKRFIIQTFSFSFVFVDPHKCCKYVCDHPSVSSTDVSPDEVRPAEIQLCDTHQLSGAGVRIQKVVTLLLFITLSHVSHVYSINPY